MQNCAFTKPYGLENLITTRSTRTRSQRTTFNQNPLRVQKTWLSLPYVSIKYDRFEQNSKSNKVLTSTTVLRISNWRTAFQDPRTACRPQRIRIRDPPSAVKCYLWSTIGLHGVRFHAHDHRGPMADLRWQFQLIVCYVYALHVCILKLWRHIKNPTRQRMRRPI